MIPATFVGLGERGKPSEAVADEAVDQLGLRGRRRAAVDPHSADQILLPLAFAPGRSEFTVSEVTEHLRTNVEPSAPSSTARSPSRSRKAMESQGGSWSP